MMEARAERQNERFHFSFEVFEQVDLSLEPFGAGSEIQELP